MERQHFMENWMKSKLLCISLILGSLFVQSLAQISAACPNTLSEIPKISPQVNIGSYESIPIPASESKRDIFIYWQTIKVNKTCEDSLQYRAFYEVITKDNTIKLVESNNIHNNHAKFFGLKTIVGYKFRIYSANKHGQSEVYSEIYVPRDSEVRFLNPLVLKKTVFDDDSTLELVWNYIGDYSDQIDSYTLFWCENDDELYSPYQCNGDLNWMYLQNTESDYTFTLPDRSKTYVFAISANGYSLFDIDKGVDQDVFMSGGMIWESCNHLDLADMALVQKVWASDIGEHRLGVRWKLDCTDNIGLFTDYSLFYCLPFYAGNNLNCKGNLKSKRIKSNGKDLMEIPFTYINYLEPSTTYVITIIAHTLSHNVITSVPLIATTAKKEQFYLLPKYYGIGDI